MKSNLHSVLLLVLAFQHANPGDSERVALLGEEAERLYGNIDDDEREALSRVLNNAYNQPGETLIGAGVPGNVPEIDPNPLGLSDTDRLLRRQKLERQGGGVVGKFAPPPVAAPAEPAPVETTGDAPLEQEQKPVLRALVYVDAVETVDEDVLVELKKVESAEDSKPGDSTSQYAELIFAGKEAPASFEKGAHFYLDFIPVPKAPVDEKPAEE